MSALQHASRSCRMTQLHIQFSPARPRAYLPLCSPKYLSAPPTLCFLNRGPALPRPPSHMPMSPPTYLGDPSTYLRTPPTHPLSAISVPRAPEPLPQVPSLPMDGAVRSSRCPSSRWAAVPPPLQPLLLPLGQRRPPRTPHPAARAGAVRLPAATRGQESPAGPACRRVGGWKERPWGLAEPGCPLSGDVRPGPRLGRKPRKELRLRESPAGAGSGFRGRTACRTGERLAGWGYSGKGGEGAAKTCSSVHTLSSLPIASQARSRQSGASGGPGRRGTCRGGPYPKLPGLDLAPFLTLAVALGLKPEPWGLRPQAPPLPPTGPHTAFWSWEWWVKGEPGRTNMSES